MKTIDYIALTLVIIGAINWGLIGFFGFDLVAFIAALCPFYPGSYMLLSVSVVFMRSVFVEG